MEGLVRVVTVGKMVTLVTVGKMVRVVTVGRTVRLVMTVRVGRVVIVRVKLKCSRGRSHRLERVSLQLIKAAAVVTSLSLSPSSENPLLVSLDTATSGRRRKTQLWFDKPAFAQLTTEADEEEELQQMIHSFEKEGGTLPQHGTATLAAASAEESKSSKETSKKKCKNEIASDSLDISRKKNISSGSVLPPEKTSSNEASSESSSDEDDDEDGRNFTNRYKSTARRSSRPVSAKGDSDDTPLEVVPLEGTSPPEKRRKLSPEGLALGSLMIQSRKKKEDLIESGYNRWTHDDNNLPDWFATDEAKHSRKQLPITKEMVEEYRAKLRDINARPIKKIAEAKARKKHKEMKRLDRARKKAENITGALDVTDHEKAQQIKSVYKKAGLLGRRKKEVKYVVAKKSTAAKKSHRPDGVKGFYKVVDPRMKKDNRAKQRAAQQKKKRKR